MLGFITLLKAWGIGITISAPLGPVGILSIRNTLERGLKGALSVGSGAAIADTAYSLLAVFSLTGVSFIWEKHAGLIQLLSALILFLLGLQEARSPTPSVPKDSDNYTSLFILFQKSFFLTLLNPMTFFGLTGLLSSMRLIYKSTHHRFIIPVGIFLGCMTWWAMLGFLLHHGKRHLSHRVIPWMKYTSAALLFGCALFSLFGSLRRL